VLITSEQLARTHDRHADHRARGIDPDEVALWRVDHVVMRGERPGVEVQHVAALSSS
jgi:hypothetical protein